MNNPNHVGPPTECTHKEEVIITLQEAAGVETIADKCTACGRMTNQRTET